MKLGKLPFSAELFGQNTIFGQNSAKMAKMPILAKPFGRTVGVVLYYQISKRELIVFLQCKNIGNNNKTCLASLQHAIFWLAYRILAGTPAGGRPQHASSGCSVSCLILTGSSWTRGSDESRGVFSEQASHSLTHSLTAEFVQVAISVGKNGEEVREGVGSCGFPSFLLFIL